MNNQVKEYFNRMKNQKRTEKPVVEHFIYLSPINEVTHHVKLKLSQDDLAFVHAIRVASHTQNQGRVPNMVKAIMARYMLLHKDPLHHFHTEWDDQKNVMHILERRNRHDGSEQTVPYAVVNDTMRKDYQHATKQSAKPKTGEDQESADLRVAKWWIDECRNAILIPAPGKKKGDENPVPQVKLLRRGSNSVSVAFKNSGGYWGWSNVHDVPVDMDKFRKQVEDQGFDVDRHAPFLMRTDRSTWDSLLKKDDDENANQYDVRTKLPYPELKKGTLNPGYNIPYEKADPEVLKKYNDDIEFRTKVEKAIVSAVAKYAGDIRGEAKKAVQIFVNWEDKNVIGNDDQYDIKIDPNRAWIPGIDEHLVRDFIQNTRLYVLKNSGHGDLDHESGDFLRRIATAGAMNAVNKIIKDKNRRAQDVGGGGDAASKSNQGRAGGRRDLAVVGGEGGGTGGAGFDVTKRDGSGAEKVGRFDTARKGDYQSDSGSYTPEDLLDAIRSDPASITNDPDTQYHILKFASTNPMIQRIADHLRDTDAILPDVEERLHGGTGTTKYQPTPRPTMAHAEHLSFAAYVAKRDKIHEMSVVWGNDKKSAKTIKPGQTLKGGIQVAGAPWSAGGKGDPNNDIQVK